MKTLIVLFSLLGLGLCAPQIDGGYITEPPVVRDSRQILLEQIDPVGRDSRQVLSYYQDDGLPHGITYIADPAHDYRFSSVYPVIHETPETLRAKAAHLEAWNTARIETGLWDRKQEVLREQMLNKEMDKFKLDSMMDKDRKDMFDKKEWERKDMLEKKEMWERKDLLDKKNLLPEPVKDTPEVELAKREHFRAHEIANARLQIENARTIPIIYSNLVGAVYGGGQGIAAARSFDSVVPHHNHSPKVAIAPIVKIVSPVYPTVHSADGY